MLWKPWTQSQCNQGTDKQTEQKSHRADFLVFADFFFFTASWSAHFKCFEMENVASCRSSVRETPSYIELFSIQRGNRLLLYCSCCFLKQSLTGMDVSCKQEPPKSHSSVSALQCGALVEWCTNLNMGCLVPNCDQPFCTYQEWRRLTPAAAFYDNIYNLSRIWPHNKHWRTFYGKDDISSQANQLHSTDTMPD